MLTQQGALEEGVKFPYVVFIATLSPFYCSSSPPSAVILVFFLRFTLYKVKFQFLDSIGLQGMEERIIRSNCLSRRLLTNSFCLQPHVLSQSCAIMGASKF